MASPGSTTNVTFAANDLLEQGILRTGLKTSDLSDENIQSALREFNLWLSGMTSRGINLWCQEVNILGMRIGQTEILLPTGTVDILDANLRTYSRLTTNGTASSSEGIAANAFDGDVTTACTQVTPGGNITYNFLGNNVRPAMFGYLSASASTLILSFQYWDGTTWQTSYTTEEFTINAGEWAYFETNSRNNSDQWRIVGDASLDPLNCDEFVIASLCTDIPLYRMNRDDYSMQPQKSNLSRVLQYWFNNRLSEQKIVPWPLSNTDFDCLQIYRTRQIEMIDDITLQLDAPQRWLDTLTWVIAYRLLCTGTGDMNRLPLVKSEMDAALELVEGEERDNSEINLFPNIMGYTRR